LAVVLVDAAGGRKLQEVCGAKIEQELPNGRLLLAATCLHCAGHLQRFCLAVCLRTLSLSLFLSQARSGAQDGTSNACAMLQLTVFPCVCFPAGLLYFSNSDSHGLHPTEKLTQLNTEAELEALK
jgi:hypothetical protein